MRNSRSYSNTLRSSGTRVAASVIRRLIAQSSDRSWLSVADDSNRECACWGRMHDGVIVHPHRRTDALVRGYRLNVPVASCGIGRHCASVK